MKRARNRCYLYSWWKLTFFFEIEKEISKLIKIYCLIMYITANPEMQELTFAFLAIVSGKSGGTCTLSFLTNFICISCDVRTH